MEDYVFVFLGKGGGSRYVIMLLLSNRIDVMKFCKLIFFFNGVLYYGKIEGMFFVFGNFYNE